MKKIAPLLVLFLFTLVVWEAMAGHGMSFEFDGDHVDGPIGAIVGLMLAGGGLLVALVVALVVTVVVTLVCAGVGLLLVVGPVLLVIVILAAVSPVLLPLLIPIAIIWYFASRNRKPAVKQHTL